MDTAVEPPKKVARVETPPRADSEDLKGPLRDTHNDRHLMRQQLSSIAADGHRVIAIVMYENSEGVSLLTTLSSLTGWSAAAVQVMGAVIVGVAVHAKCEARRVQDGADGSAVWAELGVALDDANEQPSLPHLLLVTRRDGGENGFKCVVNKPIMDAGSVLVSTLVRPVLSVEDLYALTMAAAEAHNDGFTVMWMSAAWCPPCLRILAALPELIPSAPSSIALWVKADMDLSQPIFDAFGVEIIPTFVILSHKKLLEAASQQTSSLSDSSANLAERLTAAKVDALQNSQHATVAAFLEKHCAVLTGFGDGDEDF